MGVPQTHCCPQPQSWGFASMAVFLRGSPKWLGGVLPTRLCLWPLWVTTAQLDSGPWECQRSWCCHTRMTRQPPPPRPPAGGRPSYSQRGLLQTMSQVRPLAANPPTASSQEPLCGQQSANPGERLLPCQPLLQPVTESPWSQGAIGGTHGGASRNLCRWPRSRGSR